MKPGPKPKPIIERLMNKVKIGDGDDPCWLWQGHKYKDGYGVMGTVDGTLERTHRVAYKIFVDSIPEGMCVLHSCDVRSCCNPAHLFIGTQKDNMIDMVTKGRAVDNSGEKNGYAKLTKEDVLKIRAARAGGEGLRSIAERFSVTQSNVSHIALRKNWKHVQPEN